MKITKKDFLVPLPPFRNPIIYFCTFLLILLYFVTWREKGMPLTVKIALSVFISISLVFIYIAAYKRHKQYTVPDMYMVQDTFINVYLKKRLSPLRYRIFDHIYTAKFSRNGTYEIFRNFTKDESDESDADYVTAKCSVPGDKFYLVIREYEDRKEISKCFNARFFIISKEDFDFVDGKYIKKLNPKVKFYGRKYYFNRRSKTF